MNKARVDKKAEPLQAESIKEHQEPDARLLRESYLAVINKYKKDDKIEGNASEVKVFIEACKNLARLQHLLQVDKTVQKIPEGKNKAFDTTPPKLSPKLQAKIKELRPPDEVE